MIGDASSQYNALYSYAHNILVGNDSIFYSFYNSLGGNMASTIGYYLASPFNILYVFVSKANIPFMTFIIYILKISLCSLFMNIFLNYKYGNKYTNLIFSLSYAFMGFNVVYYFNSMWLDVIYMTPLVIMGIDKLFDEKPIMYVVTLTLSIIFNFYMAYMLCIFCILYFIYELFNKYKIKDLKKYKNTIFSFVIYSLISVGISCFFLIPVLVNLSEIMRSPVDINTFNLKINNLADFVSLLVPKTYIGSNNTSSMFGRYRPVLYISLFSLLLSILYFFNTKIKRKEKILSLGIIFIFILSFITPSLQYIWQGFSFPNGYIDRYSYLYSLFIIILATKQFYSKNKISNKVLIIIYIIYLIFTCIIWLGYFSFLTPIDLLISTIFFTIYVLLYYIKSIKNIKINILLITIVIIELFINYSTTIITTKSVKKENTYSRFYNQICPITNIDDNTFYRIDGNFTYTLMDSFVCDYHNVMSGLSTINGNLYSFFKNHGESVTYTTIFYDPKKTMILQSLLDMKYLVFANKINNNSYKLMNSYNINLSRNSLNTYYDIYLYKNENALNLGFKIDSNYKDYNISKDSYDNLNNLIKSLSGVEDNILEKIDVDGKNGIYEFNLDDINKKVFMTTDYNITTNYNYYGEVYLNDEELFELNSSNIGSTLLNVSKVGKNKIEIKGKNNINNIYIYYLNENVLDKAIKRLKENQLTNVKTNGNKMKGNIYLEDDSKIFLSIPYDRGWSIYIDGKKIKYNKISGTFIQIEVPRGKHEISMRFYPKGLFVGCFISLINIFVFVFTLRKKYRKFLE